MAYQQVDLRLEQAGSPTCFSANWQVKEQRFF